jgi:hypothetical protein
MAIQVDKKWNYSFPLPQVDARSHPASVPAGYCTDIIGADHRFTGGIRRFPGFRELVDLDDEVSASWQDSGTIDFFKYAEIQKTTAGDVIRGFVVRKNNKVHFFYYDSGWAAIELDSSSTGNIDITYGGKFLYYAKDGTRGKTLFWWDATGADALELVNFGHDGKLTVDFYPWVPQSTAESILYYPAPVGVNERLITGGASDRYVMEHGLAIRFYDSRRAVYSPIHYAQQTLQLALSAAPTYPRWHSYIMQNLTAAEATTYDTVMFYRTVNFGGVLYLADYYHVPTEEGDPDGLLAEFVGDWSGTVGPVSDDGTEGDTGALIILWGVDPSIYAAAPPPGTNDYWYILSDLTDSRLIFQETLDPILDAVGDVPKGGEIIHVAGVTLKTAAGDEATQERSDLVHFSRLDKYAPSTFPPQNFYSPPRVSDKIQTFVGAGDYIFGLADSRMFRFAKVGAQMAVEKFNHGNGLNSRTAACEVGTQLAFVGDSQLFFVDPPTGTMMAVSAADRWLGDRTLKEDEVDFHLTYDSALNCLFVFAPDWEAALTVWGATNTVGRLVDMNWDACTSGPSPIALDGNANQNIDRAWFISSDGRIFYPDAERIAATDGDGASEVRQTMWGTAGTVQGTTTSTIGGVTLTDTGADFRSDGATNNLLKGAYLYIWSGNGLTKGTIQRRLITSNGATTITFTPSATGLVGTQYAVSPVIFGVRAWPLGQDDDPRTPKDTFRRRVLTAIEVAIAEGTSPTESANMTLEVGADTEFGQGSSAYSLKGLFAPKTTGSTEGVLFNSIAYDDLGSGDGAGVAAVSTAGGTVWPWLQCYSSGVDFELTGLKVSGTLEDSDISRG